MQIETDYIAKMTIEEFAEKHNLTMQITERNAKENDPARYYARFKRSDIKGDGVLIGSYGDGATPEDAIRDYARTINLKTLVIDGNTDTHREIKVPRIA